MLRTAMLDLRHAPHGHAWHQVREAGGETTVQLSRLRRRWGDLQLRGKGTVVVAIPLVILALAVVLSVIATHYNARAAAGVSAARAVAAQITTADGLVADIATDRSDYLVVGDPAYLAAADAGSRHLGASLATLSAQMSGNAAQSGRIARIQALLSAEATSSPPARTATAAVVATWVSTSRAEETAARSQLEAMNTAESAMIAHRRAIGGRWRSVDTWGSGALLALGLLGGIAGIRLFAKSIAARVDLLEAEMTSMDPASSTRPPDHRADELGRLGRRFRETSLVLASREADLRHARAFLENILTVGPMVVVRTGGRDGGATYVSPNCERVLGISPDQVTSPEFWTGLAPEDVARYYEYAARLYAADPPAFMELESSFEFEGRRRYLSVLLTRETIYDDVGLLVFFLDVTARRRAEQQAAERQRELRAITAASPDIIAVFDARLRLLWTSEAFTSVLGYRVSERLDTFATTIMHRADHELLADAVRSVIAGGAEDFTVQVRARHVQGHWVTLEGHGRPSLGPGGDPVAAVSVFRDVTERIVLEAELVEARDAANAASVAKSEFLSRMSHELRTPLNVVLGFTQLLQMDALGAEQQDWLAQILLAGRHLLDLINEVLDIARIESGALSISSEAVSVHSVVTETVESMRLIAAGHDVTITSNLGEEELFVRADRQRLKQVMLNLLSNGVKYNRLGGSIAVSTSVDGDLVKTTIADSGIGIAPQYLRRLFVPFDRLGAEDSSVEGTGVGLSLSLRLVQAMNGTVSVESAVGVGSTFTVTLPRVASPVENTADSQMDDEFVDSNDGNLAISGTVLYIEDNLTNLHFMRRVIERRPGIQLVHALQGRLGLELARSTTPDVVLLDLHLPDMSGADVLLQLRADPLTRDVPIFIVSADATSGQIERLTDAGATGYFTKPLHVPQVLALLDNALESISAHERSVHEGPVHERT
jgi:PAS domain S-box-containing protein